MIIECPANMRLQDYLLRFRGKFLSVMKIPGLLIEAAGAVIPASGYKQRYTDTFTVCNVIFIQTAVIHRCITRSLISAVRP